MSQPSQQSSGQPAQQPALVLVSHYLCPYVQRVAIMLDEKGVEYERRYVDLANKPDWFLACSPLGKTPVLLVDGKPIFESAVICEYLDDTKLPKLHPEDALARAEHRSWMEFGSAILNTIWSFYTAPDEAALAARAADLHARFALVEQALAERTVGPWFGGNAFCVVDAVFGPIFRYFDVFDRIDDFAVFQDLPKVQAWRTRLKQRSSVMRAVTDDYEPRLWNFLLARNSALSKRMEMLAAA